MMFRTTRETYMDAYLSRLGLWRKVIPRECSLFRSVCDQLFLSQTMYQVLKRKCLRYIERHPDKYEQDRSPYTEIKAMSDMYKKDFVVFQEVNKKPISFNNENSNGQVVLCQTDRHFDSVRTKENLENSAICQSIVYELLYQDVMGVDGPVERAAQMMAASKQRREVPLSQQNGNARDTSSQNGVDRGDSSPESQDDKKLQSFPFRVAKALDPTIYRNVEYDAWHYSRKEQADQPRPPFLPGDKCQVSLDVDLTTASSPPGPPPLERVAEGVTTPPEQAPPAGRLYNAHIQELGPNNGPVTVFVAELGEKRTVPYSHLRPLPQQQSAPTHPNHGTDSNFGGRRRIYRNRKEMPLMLPPFGRGGAGSGGSGLPPRLQGQRQEAENTPGHKRITFTGHMPGGRGLRPSWAGRQPPGFSGPRADRHPQDQEEDPSSGVSLEQLEEKEKERLEKRRQQQEAAVCLDPDDFPALPTKIDRIPAYKVNSVKLSKQPAVPVPPPPMPSGCPLPSKHPACPPPPPGALPAGPPPSPFLFPPPPSGSAGVSPFQVPFCPYLVVPHIDQSVPINLGVQMSADPTGADLPNNDKATLRFFFNLGLEYYRLCTLFQVQQQQHYASFINQQMATGPGAAPPPTDGAIYVGDLEGEAHGTSRKTDRPKDVPSDKSKEEKEVVKKAEEKEEVKEEEEESKEEVKEEESVAVAKDLDETENVERTVPMGESKKEEVVSKQEVENKAVSKDNVSGGFQGFTEQVAADSGCPSEVSSGAEGCQATEECCETSDLPFIYDNHSDNSDSHNPSDSQSDSSSQHSTSNLSVISTSSGGSDCSGMLYQNKPYYVPLRSRSSPKLLKPLKDIPPRFQKMLSSNPAIRQEQFEGQPIMRQPYNNNHPQNGHNHHHRPKSVTVSANNINDLPNHHNFNPFAETFIPRQSCAGSTDTTNSGSSSNPSSHHPAKSSSMVYTCHKEVLSECCSSTTSSEGTCGSMPDSPPSNTNNNMAVQSWCATAPATGVATAGGPAGGAGGGAAAPTYTIHIFNSGGCSIEPQPGAAPCQVNNHCLSSTTSPGCYAVSNIVPAPGSAPATYPVAQVPSDGTSAVVTPNPQVQVAPPPPTQPPGGIVYYCQPPQQPATEGYPQGYNAAPYAMPAPGAATQYIYSATPAYPAYETYNYS